MTLKLTSKPRRAASHEAAVDVVRRLEMGLPFSSFARLQKQLDTSPDEMARITRISPRSLARRKREGRFNLEESERIHRLSTVFQRALGFFDADLDATRRWLQKPRPAFGNKSALTFARTGVGAQEVQDLLGRLEHGVYW
jgi:putative toxin-antitoxin system antitoxin component (TIGR02293 family)